MSTTMLCRAFCRGLVVTASALNRTVAGHYRPYRTGEGHPRPFGDHGQVFLFTTPFRTVKSIFLHFVAFLKSSFRNNPWRIGIHKKESNSQQTKPCCNEPHMLAVLQSESGLRYEYTWTTVVEGGGGEHLRVPYGKLNVNMLPWSYYTFTT